MGKILLEGKRFPTGRPENMEQWEVFQGGKGQPELHALSLDMTEARAECLSNDMSRITFERQKMEGSTRGVKT